MSMSSLYDILELPRTATSSDIRRAYKRLAKQYHPDRLGGDPQQFQRLYYAYSVLMDKDQRRDYDHVTAASPNTPCVVGQWVRIVLMMMVYFMRHRKNWDFST